jgi:hypothetical protein
VFSNDFETDVPDAEGDEAEGGVVLVAEDLLEVPGARAGRVAGVVVLLTRLGLYGEVVDDGLDTTVQNVEVVEDREHGEVVRGGVRVHAATGGELDGKIVLSVVM